MNRRTVWCWLTSLAVITVLQWPSTLHAQDSCQPVFDALDKVFTSVYDTKSQLFHLHRARSNDPRRKNLYPGQGL